MFTYYVSMGSNLGDREEYLRSAMIAFSTNETVQSVERSNLYETEPWGYTEQPPFINAVCRVETLLNPPDFLRFLQDIEKRAQRQRVIHWGPRTLDLDIVWAEHDGRRLSLASPELTVPHPHFWDRLFVLEPLADLCPNFFYHGDSIEERISQLKAMSL